MPILLTCTLLLSPTIPLRAQFWDRMTNPSMDVPVKHPPQIVIANLKKVAVGKFDGQNGDQISDLVAQAFLSSGQFEVVDRANIEAIMQGQGIPSTVAFTPDTAIKLGRASGCDAILTGKVAQYAIETSPLLDAGTCRKKVDGVKMEVQRYAIRVKARLAVSIQVVDLRNGHTYTGKMVYGEKTLENVAEGGEPVPPDASTAFGAAWEIVRDQLKQIILPWTETVELVVYNDTEMNLKLSANQIKVGDFAGAVQTMESAINGIADPNAVDPKLSKYVPRVYYNYGIALMYSGSPEKAIPAFQKSQQLRPTNITQEAIDAANKMIALRNEQTSKEVHAAQIESATEATQAKQNASRLTNASVIDMTKAGLGDDIIIARIRKNPNGLDGSTEGLIALKKGGVSNAVIKVIGETAPQ